MTIELNWKECVLTEELNLRQQLELNELTENKSKWKIGSAGYMLWVLCVFIESIWGNRKGDYIKEFIGWIKWDDIELLQNSVDNISNNYAKSMEAKKANADIDIKEES